MSKIHVEREVHVLFRQVSDREDVERDSHSDGYSSIVWPYSPVVANLERVEKIGDVEAGVGGPRQGGVGPGGVADQVGAGQEDKEWESQRHLVVQHLVVRPVLPLLSHCWLCLVVSAK